MKTHIKWKYVNMKLFGGHAAVPSEGQIYCWKEFTSKEEAETWIARVNKPRQLMYAELGASQ